MSYIPAPYVPPPSVAPTLLVPDAFGTDQSLPLPVRVVTGSGIVAGRGSGLSDLTLTSAAGDQVETVCVFAPGAQGAAATLALARNVRGDQTCLPLLLEANYLRLLLKDGFGDQIALPIQAAGVASYGLNAGGAVVQAGSYSYSTANKTQLSAGYNTAQDFTPTQDLTVSSFRIGGWLYGGAPAFSPRFAIWTDGDGKPGTMLGKSYVKLVVAAGSAGNPATNVAQLMGFQLPEPITLKSGVRYWLTLDAFENGPTAYYGSSIAGFSHQAGSGYAPAGGPTPFATTGRTLLSAYYNGQSATSYGDRFDWPKWGGALPAGLVVSTTTGRTDAGALDSGQLFGTAGGTTLRGDLTVALDVIGAPTGFGSDLNVRAVLL